MTGRVGATLSGVPTAMAIISQIVEGPRIVVRVQVGCDRYYDVWLTVHRKDQAPNNLEWSGIRGGGPWDESLEAEAKAEVRRWANENLDCFLELLQTAKNNLPC